jgi:hypothetical protein
MTVGELIQNLKSDPKFFARVVIANNTEGVSNQLLQLGLTQTPVDGETAIKVIEALIESGRMGDMALALNVRWNPGRLGSGYDEAFAAIVREVAAKERR